MKEILINHIIQHRTSYATDIEILKSELKYEKELSEDDKRQCFLYSLWKLFWNDIVKDILLNKE